MEGWTLGVLGSGLWHILLWACCLAGWRQATVLVSWLTGSPEARPEACEQMRLCLPLCLRLLVAAHSCLPVRLKRLRAEGGHLPACHSCWELSSVLPLPREVQRALRVTVLSGMTGCQWLFSPFFFQLHLRCCL